MAKRKVNVDFSSSTFKLLNEELTQLVKNADKDINNALNECADYVVDKLKAKTPTRTGETKKSWKVEKKYNKVKYIFNTRLGANGVPIINVLEYSKLHGKPFVNKTISECQLTMEKIIERGLKNG